MERRNNRPKPGGRRQRGEAGEDKKGGSRSDYKAKRSFTKNKDLRDKQKSGDRPYRSSGRGPAKRAAKPVEGMSEKRSYRPSEGGREERRGKTGERDKPRRSFGSRDNEREERYTGASGRERAPRDRDKPKRSGRSFESDREDRPSRPGRRGDDEKPYRSSAEREDRGRAAGGERRPWSEDKKSGGRRNESRGERPGGLAKRERSFDGEESRESSRRVKFDEFEEGRAFSKNKPREREKEKKKPAPKNDDGLIRLNKYLSNAGIASRREADNLIQSGAVKVNGVVVDQLGAKIKTTDKVTYGDESVKAERKVYLLLNKPKDYITTVDDPRDRKTVMELIAGACRERVYPVGRLDRNTTGLLLFTNDGELTTRLTHPKHNVKKVYHVTLNKGLKTDDFRSIIEGVELEDGVAKADDLAFVGEGKKEVGIEIHSGKNRIVRRIFEHLGYDVIKLDRVVFAGLTKKDLPRGKYRFLTQKEIGFLHMIG